jgi:DnaK suppressor protein
VAEKKSIAMTQEERGKIRDHIMNEIATLRKSIVTLTELLDSEAQEDANDWFTTKESNPSKEINEMALAKARQQLRIFNEVVNRTDNPDFGICVICSKPIPYERMKAVPTATRCTSCK